MTARRVTSPVSFGARNGSGVPEVASRTAGRIRSVLCSPCRTEISGRFNYCGNCGMQQYRGPPTPLDPAGSIVQIDAKTLNARRATVRAAMAGRPGQRREIKIADELDTLIRASSGCRKGWATAIDDDVLDYCYYLDSQGNGTTWVHVLSCQGWTSRTQPPASPRAVVPNGTRPSRSTRVSRPRCVW